jgi:hypothetical protein
MTSPEALVLLRARLHETTAGYFSDAALYAYLNSAQLGVIDYFLNQRNYFKKIDPFYEPRVLRPLIASNGFNLVLGTQEYDVDAAANDFRETIGATLKYSAGVSVRATYFPKNEIDWKALNVYSAPSVTSPAYYIAGTNIGFVPIPDASTAGGVHTYYKTPATVAAGQNFILTSETHNAIVAYALYLALQEDSRPEASQAIQEYFQLIKQVE